MKVVRNYSQPNDTDIVLDCSQYSSLNDFYEALSRNLGTNYVISGPDHMNDEITDVFDSYAQFSELKLVFTNFTELLSEEAYKITMITDIIDSLLFMEEYWQSGIGDDNLRKETVSLEVLIVISHRSSTTHLGARITEIAKELILKYQNNITH